MAKRKNNAQTAESSAATVGYEAQLWQMADALRGSMDAAGYKHVALGLIFLKYIPDAFEEQHVLKRQAQLKGKGSEVDAQLRRQCCTYLMTPRRLKSNCC